EMEISLMEQALPTFTNNRRWKYMITNPMRGLRCRGFCCLASTLIMILALVAGLSAKSPEVSPQGNPESVAVEYQDTLLSVEAQRATLLTVFQAIAAKTHYEFVVPEELLQREVTLTCSKTDLDKAVKRVLDASGVCNYALVSGVREPDTGSKSIHQIQVVLVSAARESSAGERSREEARLSRLKSDAQTSISERSPRRSYVEGGPPSRGSATGRGPRFVPVLQALTPEEKQGEVGEVPTPGQISTDLPQTGPVSKDLPQPGPVPEELP
ncbi:MAG: hypothetical protein ACFFCW_16650, partial [Candidatus Hodarchaeota archaeon]